MFNYDAHHEKNTEDHMTAQQELSDMACELVELREKLKERRRKMTKEQAGMDSDKLQSISEYLWELKCQNEWKRDTTIRNIRWLNDLQETIDYVYKLQEATQ